MSMTDTSFMMDVIRVDVRGVRPFVHPSISIDLWKRVEKKKTKTKKKPI
jgi:hypothetical protein